MFDVAENDARQIDENMHEYMNKRYLDQFVIPPPQR